MSTDDRDDPGADTAMFRAYVEDGNEPAPAAPAPNPPTLIAAAVAVAVVVVLLVIMLASCPPPARPPGRWCRGSRAEVRRGSRRPPREWPRAGARVARRRRAPPPGITSGTSRVGGLVAVPCVSPLDPYAHADRSDRPPV